MNPLKRVLRRFRSAITGRFVRADYAEANPSTTVAERPPLTPRPTPGERGPAPGDWRCNAPGAVCVNQRRCDQAGKCLWESWEAANPPRPGSV